MRVKILITGGGTGGHVYPALSTIQSLQIYHGRDERSPADDLVSDRIAGQDTVTGGADHSVGLRPSELAYVGNERGMERELAPRSGVRCYFMPMAPPASPRGIALLALATLRSLVLLLRLRPRVIFGTGGYVCAPAAVAGWLLRVPVVLFLPDVVPGKAVAFLAPLARRLLVSNEEARRRLPAGKTVVTGYPVRDYFLVVSGDRARRRHGIPKNARLLLVFGGSQGARAINQAVAACLPELLASCFVVHISGEDRLEEAQSAAEPLTAQQRRRYRLVPYLHDQEMADALAAADLAVCRSGASTLAELPLTATPAILVPLPETRVHQLENANYLANRGAAVVLEEGRLAGELAPMVRRLFAEPERLRAMSAAAHAQARPDASKVIAREVLRYV